MIGSILNKRTTTVPTTASSPFYQQQADAQASQMSQMHMMRRRDSNQDDVAPPGSEQTHWFSPSPQFAGSQYNPDGSGGQYSSYADYDHSLDQRIKQEYKESHEGDGKNVHYK